MVRSIRNLSAFLLAFVVMLAASRTPVGALTCNETLYQCNGNNVILTNCNDSCEAMEAWLTDYCQGHKPSYFNCGGSYPHSATASCESRACID